MAHGSDNFKSIICGGEEVDDFSENEMCYSLSELSHRLQHPGKLQASRIGAASLVINNGTSFWITGGKDNNHLFQTSEIVELTETGDSLITREGPTLPKKLRHHCLTRVGPSIAIMVGGDKCQDDTGHCFEQSSWSINLDSMIWSLQGPLNMAREKHACCVLKDSSDPDNARKIIVASGGDGWMLDSRQVLRSVETLIVEDESFLTWEHGPNMPMAIRDTASVTNADQLKMFIIGGSTSQHESIDFEVLSTIFELQCPGLQCHWQLVFEMSKPSFKGLAFILPSTVMSAKWKPDIACPHFGNVQGRDFKIQSISNLELQSSR